MLEGIATQLYRNIQVLVVGPEILGRQAIQVLESAGWTSATLIPCDHRLDQGGRYALGLNAARGILTMPLDAGDVLPETAAYLIARALMNASRPPAFVYGDEDEVDANRSRASPFFKPRLLGELVLSIDIAGPGTSYLTAALRNVCQTTNVSKRAWRWHMVLRLIEEHGIGCGLHLPYVIGHRHEKPVEFLERIACARAAVEDHISRSNVRADVKVDRTGCHLALSPRPPELRPSVTAIVATRDRCHLLKRCLTGLLNETTYPHLQVLLIDNDSSEPETLEYLASLSQVPRIRVLPYHGPFNFADINNHAAEEADGEIIALINNNVEVMNPDWLDAMVAYAVRSEVGAVGAKLLYPDHRIQHAGVVIGLGGVTDHIFRGLRVDDPGPHGLLSVPQNVSAVTGACMVLRRNVYREVGGMDSVFAVAFNDIDLCMRLRARGYEIIWTPRAELIHHESATRSLSVSNRSRRRAAHEESMFRERWLTAGYEDPYYNPNLTLTAPWRGVSLEPTVSPPWDAEPH